MGRGRLVVLLSQKKSAQTLSCAKKREILNLEKKVAASGNLRLQRNYFVMNELLVENEGLKKKMFLYFNSYLCFICI